MIVNQRHWFRNNTVFEKDVFLWHCRGLRSRFTNISVDIIYCHQEDKSERDGGRWIMACVWEIDEWKAFMPREEIMIEPWKTTAEPMQLLLYSKLSWGWLLASCTTSAVSTINGENTMKQRTVIKRPSVSTKLHLDPEIQLWQEPWSWWEVQEVS